MKWLISEIVNGKKIPVKMNGTSFNRAKVCADYYRKKQNTADDCMLQIDVVNPKDGIISTSWIQEHKYKHWVEQAAKKA